MHQMDCPSHVLELYYCILSSESGLSNHSLGNQNVSLPLEILPNVGWFCCCALYIFLVKLRAPRSCY